MGTNLIIKNADFSLNKISGWVTNIKNSNYFENFIDIYDGHYSDSIPFWINNTFDGQVVEGKTIKKVAGHFYRFVSETPYPISSLGMKIGYCDLDGSNRVVVTNEEITSEIYTLNTPVSIPQGKTLYFEFVLPTTPISGSRYGILLVRPTGAIYSELKSNGIYSGYSYLYNDVVGNAASVIDLDFYCE